MEEQREYIYFMFPNRVYCADRTLQLFICVSIIHYLSIY